MPELESFSLDPASPSDWSAVRAQGHRMLDDLFDHLAQIRERPVWQPIPAEVRAVADIPPDVRKKVRAGQEAVIQIAELADGVPATVTEVRDNQVVIDFTSPNPLIKPGITAQIAIKPD